MGASHGKKRSYSIHQENQLSLKSGKHPNIRTDVQKLPCCRTPPTHSSTLQPSSQLEDVELIQPRKLVNPVKSSRSHQELHRELLSRRGCVEMKPELQRVLESRKREQLIRQRKQEDAANRKLSPLEAELQKRHDKLEELEQQQQPEVGAPEFIKVKKNLRRTSIGKDQTL